MYISRTIEHANFVRKLLTTQYHYCERCRDKAETRQRQDREKTETRQRQNFKTN